VKKISKSQFKPHALRYFREVEDTGQDLVITDRGTPVLRITPYRPDAAQALKELRHSVLRYDDATEPVAVDAWDALK
jgi:prevent-host-death family protein